MGFVSSFPAGCISGVNRPVLLLSFALFFFIGFAGSPSFSADKTAGKDKDHIPIVGEAAEKMMDETQEGVSKRVISAAEWLDSFFNDGRVTSEENKSRATLSLESKYTKNDDFELNPRISIRLKFPKLSKKINFLLQAADDEDFDVDGDPTHPGGRGADRGNLEAALQFFFLDTDSQNISTSFGGSYDYVYGGLRYRYWKDIGKWDLRFTDRARWYSDDGWENRASLDLERKISQKWMFRSITSATWAEIVDGVPHSEILRLYQVIDEEQAILYETGIYLDTEPDYDVTDIQLKVRYRQRFYRDWLVLEIAPQVTFPKDYDREANPGIIFKLEADFGYESEDQMFRKIFSF